MDGQVRVIVGQIPDEKGREERFDPGRAESSTEQPEQKNGDHGRRGEWHQQPSWIIGVLVVDTMDEELPAPPRGRARHEMKYEPVQRVLDEAPREQTACREEH